MKSLRCILYEAYVFFLSDVGKCILYEAYVSLNMY